MKRPESQSRLKGLRRASILSLLAAIHAVTAQEQPKDTSVVSWSQLRTKPQLLDSARDGGVRFPPLLQTANVGGDVSLVLVVGEDGRPITGLTRIEKSSHDLFSGSARAATSRWQFAPPTMDGVPMRAEVPVGVSFTLPSDLEGPVREISSLSADSSGVHVLAGWELLPREISAPRDTADVKWAKLIVLLQLLAMNEAGDTPAKTCVRWSDKATHALPPTMMRRIRAQYADVVNADACPRPKGQVKPVWVAVGSVEPWTTDLYLVAGHVESTGTDDYYCEARRDERGRWGGTCELRFTTIH